MSETCRVCGKELIDPESVKDGIGPICRAKLEKYEAFEEQSTELAQIDQINNQLATVEDVQDVRSIIAMADAYISAARSRYRATKGIAETKEDSERAYNIGVKASEVRLKAEARIGEIIREMQSRGELASQETGRCNTDVTPLTLPDIGLTRIESSRFQKVADAKELIPEIVKDAVIKQDFPTRSKLLAEYKKIEREQEIEEIRESIKNIVEPKGPYDVIVIDPPWNYGSSYNPDGRRAASPYPEMSLEEIKNIELPAKDDCVLWLWTTNAFMHEAYHVLDAWGFEPKTILTWVKDRMGLGAWLRNITEHCILAVKGSPLIDLSNQTTVIHAKNEGHSIKPNEFYDLVETLCVGNKIDWFSRKTRKGWANYGTLEFE